MTGAGKAYIIKGITWQRISDDDRRIEMAKKKKMTGKSMTELMMQMRSTWQINPRTRVQENEQKNKKKIREEGRKIIEKDNGGLD